MMLARLVMIVLVLACHSAAIAATYEIVLKNGRSLKTSMYWKEGDEIHFFIYGGEMGLPLSAVNEIRRIQDRKRPGGRDGQTPPRTGVPFQSPGKTGAGQGDSSPDHPELVRQFQEDMTILFHRSRLIPAMGRDELLAFAREAESLKKRIIKSPVAQHLNPTLLQLEELLEHLEEELERRS